MAFKTNRLGFGFKLGVSKNWTILKFSKTQLNIHLELIFLKRIINAYESLILLPKKGIKTKQKTKEEKKLKIPIRLGTFILIFTQKINIKFNYFFDYNKLSKKNLMNLNIKLFSILLQIKKLYNNNISIKAINLYNLIPSVYFLTEMLYNTTELSYIKKQKQQIYLKEIRFKLFQKFFANYGIYNHKNQRYFLRIGFMLLIALFCKDAILYAKAIAQELQNMRKKHKKLILMVQGITYFCIYENFQILKNEYNSFTKNNYKILNWNKFLYILGARILFKGRITTGTRQRRRKLKYWVAAGSLKYTDLKAPLQFGNAIAITRFGILSVKVWFQPNNNLRYFDSQMLNTSRFGINY